MDTDTVATVLPNAPSNRFSFSMSNLLLLVALTAVCLAWWLDHNRVRTRDYDVTGPISASYTVRTSPSSTSGGTIRGALGINFQGENIVVHTSKGGRAFSTNNLMEFRWERE